MITNSWTTRIIGGDISGITKYLVDGVLIPKNDEFLQWLNAFYRWIKKNFIAIKIDAIHMVYISGTVQQMLEEGYILE